MCSYFVLMYDLQTLPDIDPAALAEQRLEALTVLAELGLGLARRIVVEAEATEPGALDIGAAALAYARIAKGVRQCLMLQARLEAEEARRLAGRAALQP